MSEKLKSPEKRVVNIYDGEKYKLVTTPKGDKYILDSGEEENEDEKKPRK
jgi:hypothetical protein